MQSKTKTGDSVADKLPNALHGAQVADLVVAWTGLMRGLDKRAHAEAESLLLAADTMGVLALADHIERHRPSAMVIARLVALARAQQRSLSGSRAAKMKNLEAKQWVCSEWVAHRAEFAKPGGGFYKVRFARRYSKRIARDARFNSAAGEPLKVTPDRIARYWLKD